MSSKQSSNKDWQSSEKKGSFLRKRLFSTVETLEKKNCKFQTKLQNVQAEKAAVAEENQEKRQTLIDLRQTNKQLTQALKKTKSELKKTRSEQARNAEINAADLAEENELLKQTNEELDGKLREETSLRQKIEEKLSKQDFDEAFPE